MTLIAAPIMVQSVEHGLAETARAAEFGADLVEFRVDQFTDSPEAAADLVARASLPCIVTCRPTWEGGYFAGTEAQRILLLNVLAEATVQPAYVDIELIAFQKSPALREALRALTRHGDPAAPGLILSSHDFKHRPAHLFRTLEAMAEEPLCRVMKIAWFARSLRDNLEIFDILAQSLKPTIALAMGEFGLPSRVLAGKFGALLTFASIDDQSVTAPGQPTIAELKNLYRFDQIQASTEIFGVIGWPVGHSMSPAIHNAGFDAAGVDAAYLPMAIPPEYEHFKATVDAWLNDPSLHFRGASVTIPHKHNLLRFVNEQGGEIEHLAAAIGAANTLSCRADGSLYASNTDYAAALDAVCDAMGIERAQLAGKRVAVLGAGGAARAVVAGFSHYGCAVTIYNRTLEKAEALAAEFNTREVPVKAAKLNHLPNAGADILINCTPIGMHPKVDDTPVKDFACDMLIDGAVVFDTIYNPIETRLLRDAKEAECVTVSGTEMFVRQAATQFEGWTKKEAPLDVFLAVLNRQLAPHPYS